MNLPKFLIGIAIVAPLVVVSWRMGDARGYERGRKTKGAEFQVMLDANVYWAHRDALYAISARGSAWALNRELNSLNDYYERVMKAKGADLPSNIRLNFIDSVERHHQEHLDRFQGVLKELKATAGTPAESAAETIQPEQRLGP